MILRVTIVRIPARRRLRRPMVTECVFMLEKWTPKGFMSKAIISWH